MDHAACERARAGPRLGSERRLHVAPPLPATADTPEKKDAHKFTDVATNGFSTKLSVAMVITGRWKLEGNYSIKAATLEAPDDVVPKVKFPLHTVFAKDAAFKKWFAEVSEHSYKLGPGNISGDDKEVASKIVAAGLQLDGSGEGASGSSGKRAAADDDGSADDDGEEVAKTATPAPAKRAKNAIDYTKVAAKVKEITKARGST